MEDASKMNNNTEWARTIASASKNEEEITLRISLFRGTFRPVHPNSSDSLEESITVVYLLIGNAGSRLDLHCPQTSSDNIKTDRGTLASQRAKEI